MQFTTKELSFTSKLFLISTVTKNMLNLLEQIVYFLCSNSGTYDLHVALQNKHSLRIILKEVKSLSFFFNKWWSWHCFHAKVLCLAISKKVSLSIILSSSFKAYPFSFVGLFQNVFYFTFLSCFSLVSINF